MVLLPIVGLVVAAWGYRDFRRRSGLEVVIDRREVTVGIDSSQRALNFADVVSIRIIPTRLDYACVLIPRIGRSLRLPPEIAPFSVVRDALDQTLIPEIVERWDKRMTAGDAVELQISPRRLFLMMSRAVGALLLGGLMLLNPWMIPMGVLVVRHSATVIQQLRLGFHGGFVVDRRGLRHHAESTEEFAAWNCLERIRSDSIGLVLRSTDGRIFALSSLTVDFWPALRWLNGRLKSSDVDDRQ